MFRSVTYFIIALAVALSAISCERKPAGNTSSPQTNAVPKVYQVKGAVVEIKPNRKTAKIKHEEIPGYMAAMTMDLDVKDTNELTGLKAGDAISFRMLVTEDDGWIDQVKKLGTASPTELPSRQSIRLARDVEPLNVGDVVPEYHFTNQLGQPISLSQFKGQAVAITFIFTTCPFPTFCPRMSQNFAEAQKKLKQMPDPPKNWQLLEISFDPEKDTPAVLKRYADRYDYDPAHWSFLTGDLIDITAICEQFGVQFWREGGTINHNLRTVVIDSQGKVHKILPANDWKSDQLVEEIIKAAQAR